MSETELSMISLKRFRVENGNKNIEKNHNVSKEDVSKREQQDNIIESPPWSDLHTSLLDRIAGNLCYVDQVIFHAVCKSWNAAQYKTKPADLMPWVVRVLRSTSLDMFQCRVVELYAIPLLCQPDAIPLEFYPKQNLVQNIYLDQFVSSYPLRWQRNIDITCNFGWILFGIPTKDYSATTFLFYSPLTKEVVVLPRLIYSRGTNCELTTGFSAEPDSPDFVLLVVRHSEIKTISTYSQGQGKWNAEEHIYLFSDIGPDSFILYIRKLFFFVHDNGCLTSYNISTSGSGRWKQESVSSNRTISKSRMRHAFESNGELLLVHCSETFEYGVSRFDWSGKHWIALNNLSDRTLFVGLNSYSFKALEEEEPSNYVLSNNIHVLRNSWHNVYDLKGGKVSKVFMNRDAFRIGDSMQLQNESTFWFKPPSIFVTRKQ